MRTAELTVSAEDEHLSVEGAHPLITLNLILVCTGVDGDFVACIAIREDAYFG
jgi:hypothetical protein